mmetsp:Transcript_7406/g.17858  ORF Transcript_7406/g.17858 Transcript_7406/m.17858 type:complete len:98 (-) Transcript_7406:1866-2159(-)
MRAKTNQLGLHRTRKERPIAASTRARRARTKLRQAPAVPRLRVLMEEPDRLQTQTRQMRSSERRRSRGGGPVDVAVVRGHMQVQAVGERVDALGRAR